MDMEQTKKRLVVLTSGGDAPGMNACVRAITRKAINQGVDVLAALDGFRGLSEGDFIPLDYESVSGVIDRGGTFIGTARYPAFLEETTRLKAWAHLKKENAIGVIGIGGDGTYHGLKALSELSTNVIGVPGTIDNDIPLTDFTLGFSTALDTIVEALERIRDTMSSHHRIFVVEVMGRHCGELASYAGLASGADCVITKDNFVDYDTCVEQIREVKERRGKRQLLIVCQENVLDVAKLATLSEKATGIESRYEVLGHIQRGGFPSAYDRVLGTLLGEKAATLLLEGSSGLAVGIEDNKVTTHSFVEVLNSQRKLHPELLDAERNIR